MRSENNSTTASADMMEIADLQLEQDLCGAEVRQLEIKLLSRRLNHTLQDSRKRLVRKMLENVESMFHPMFSDLWRSDLSPLQDVPLSTQTLWSTSTSSCPSLLNASHCWLYRRPSVRDLVLSTLEHLSKDNSSGSECDYKVNSRGESDQSVKPGTAVAQLVEPDSSSPVFLTGLRLPVMAELGFQVPYELSAIVEPVEESNVQTNLTPKYTFVDLHIG
jgi:hypothetical protein